VFPVHVFYYTTQALTKAKCCSLNLNIIVIPCRIAVPVFIVKLHKLIEYLRMRYLNHRRLIWL